MNSIIEDTSMDVFHSSLDADEQRAVADLVDRHRGNAAMTQRMALDASRLLSSSQERLQKQAGPASANVCSAPSAARPATMRLPTNMTR